MVFEYESEQASDTETTDLKILLASTHQLLMSFRNVNMVRSALTSAIGYNLVVLSIYTSRLEIVLCAIKSFRINSSKDCLLLEL